MDGIIHVSGDAVAQLGAAVSITLSDGTRYFDYFDADTWTYKGGESATGYYYPGKSSNDVFDTTGPPLTLKNDGPLGIDLAIHGNTMTIETLLYVRAQTGALQHGAGTADADFSNTMRVSNIQFFDDNGQVIPDVQVVGSDGAVYPYNVVPEPSTLALFGAGSIGLLFARFRRTQRS
jgi:hypothetical protein